MKKVLMILMVGLLSIAPFDLTEAGVGSPEGAIAKAKALARQECLSVSQKKMEMITLAAIAPCPEGPFWYVAVSVYGKARGTTDVPVPIATVRFYCDGSEEVICL
jgi:hypothetical protein